MNFSARSALVAAVSMPLICSPLFAYNFPLTPGDIRNAYLLGTESGSSRDRFFAQYSRDLPEIHIDGLTSNVSISTPYLQVAERASQDVNKNLQAALDAFSGTSLRFRIDAKIVYLEPKTASPHLHIAVLQNDKEISMNEESRDPLMPYDSPPYGYVINTSDGEEVVLSCEASKISSDSLKIVIDIPGDVPAGTTQPRPPSSSDPPGWSEVSGSPKAIARQIEVKFDLSELK